MRAARASECLHTEIIDFHTVSRRRSVVLACGQRILSQGRFELPRLVHDHLSPGAQVLYQDLLQVN
jgi:hypothetical protein